MLEHRHAEATLPARTVVLGATGFVGAAITRHLQQRGGRVLALGSADLDLTASDATARLATTFGSGDAVVLVSALAPCKDVPTLMKNLRMVEAVCPPLSSSEISHLVYISSDAVYSDEPQPVTERSCAGASFLHAIMHRTRELMLEHAARMPLAMLRPSLLFGATDPHNGYGPNRFRRSALTERRITLFGEGEEQRDHVWVDDVARIVAHVLEHRSHGVLNVATGRSASFYRVAELVAAQFAEPVEIVTTPRQSPVTHRHFDITATLKAFPFFRFTPLEDGIRRVHQEGLAERAQ